MMHFSSIDNFEKIDLKTFAQNQCLIQFVNQLDQRRQKNRNALCATKKIVDQ